MSAVPASGSRPTFTRQPYHDTAVSTVALGDWSRHLRVTELRRRHIQAPGEDREPARRHRGKEMVLDVIGVVTLPGLAA